MSDAFIIEVAGEAAGIVVRTGKSFRFFASTRQYQPLEGSAFTTPRQARLAAARLSGGGKTDSTFVPEGRRGPACAIASDRTG